jgi:SAM-dependent methyltransferase
VDAEEWNDRYAEASLLWSATPNRWVASELADVPAGRALDLAAGEGRNACWLATRGCTVTAVDFSSVALDRGRQQAEAAGVPADRLRWIEADLLDYCPEVQAYDVVLIAYLQLPERPRRLVTARAVEALAPGGTLLVVGHDLANLTYGTGGPQEGAVLFRPDDVIADIRSTDRPVQIVRADSVRRPVEGADRDAIDVLVRAQVG